MGFPVPNWHGATFPPREEMRGRFCHLAPLQTEKHARDLWESFELDTENQTWTYLYHGPFEAFEGLEQWIEFTIHRTDAIPFAIVDATTLKAIGIAMYLRIDSNAGSIEVGNLHFSPLLQRTPAATEAMFLMMERAFASGYRRYEWKCNALNAPSRRAALRLGFSFEGIFRQAAVVKGCNRDTAWFSVLDEEWPMLKKGFEKWLSSDNFEADGRQKLSLEACREAVLAQTNR
jgi:RimJ/RimL family protein N-acetyltransferase